MVDKEVIKNVFDNVVMKSYGHKPHLASLPYDHNTNDPDKLQERLDVLGDRISETEELIGTEAWIQEDRQKEIDRLTKENDDLQKKLDAIDEYNEEFDAYSSKLQRDTADLISDFQDTYRELFEGTDLVKGMINGKPNFLYSEVMGLQEVFEYSGLIPSMDANALKGLADKIVKESSNYDKGSAWSKKVEKLADTLVDIANTNDINKHPAGKVLEKLSGMESVYAKEDWDSQLKSNNEEISRSMDVIKDSIKTQNGFERELNDYKKEYKRTEQHLDASKKNNKD